MTKIAGKVSRDIHEYMEEQGPVYFTTVIPDYAARDWRLGQYEPWYLGHTDVEALEPKVIGEHFLDWCKTRELVEGQEDTMGDFMEYLIELGYVVPCSSDNEGPVVLEFDNVCSKAEV